MEALGAARGAARACGSACSAAAAARRPARPRCWRQRRRRAAPAPARRTPAPAPAVGGGSMQETFAVGDEAVAAAPDNSTYLLRFEGSQSQAQLPSYDLYTHRHAAGGALRGWWQRGGLLSWGGQGRGAAALLRPVHAQVGGGGGGRGRPLFRSRARSRGAPAGHGARAA